MALVTTAERIDAKRKIRDAAAYFGADGSRILGMLHEPQKPTGRGLVIRSSIHMDRVVTTACDMKRFDAPLGAEIVGIDAGAEPVPEALEALKEALACSSGTTAACYAGAGHRRKVKLGYYAARWRRMETPKRRASGFSAFERRIEPRGQESPSLIGAASRSSIG